MIVEQKLQSLGLVVPDLEQDYATNPSGARFISHYAVQNVLYLSGTAPVKDGKPYRPGVVGKDLTEYSLDTVQMFRRDAIAAGYEIGPVRPLLTAFR